MVKQISKYCALFIVLLCIVVYALGYHGQRNFDRADMLSPIELVVYHARSLKGTPYDPFMGEHANIGAKAGFIVCSDVPNIAYGLSGFSFKTLLAQDYVKHPHAYGNEEDNTPKNSYFHRRARNLYAYFTANSMAFPASNKPHAGDLVFYSHKEKDYISHVALVTEVSKESYMIMESASSTHFAQEIDGRIPLEKDMKIVGFGRMYCSKTPSHTMTVTSNSPKP